jgi:hypothetical protein
MLRVLVPLEFAEFGDFFIGKPPYMHLRERHEATVAFRLHGHQHYHHVFFGEDMMNLDGEDAATTQCQGVFEKSDDLVAALNRTTTDYDLAHAR